MGLSVKTAERESRSGAWVAVRRVVRAVVVIGVPDLLLETAKVASCRDNEAHGERILGSALGFCCIRSSGSADPTQTTTS